MIILIDSIFTKSIGPLIPFDQLINANSRTSTDRINIRPYTMCVLGRKPMIQIHERRRNLLEHT